MKKLRSILFIMLFVLFPSTVFASSGSGSLSLGNALRSGSSYFYIYTKFFIRNNFKGRL